MIETLSKDQLIELLNKRHSVRRYKEDPIKDSDIIKIQEILDNINKESGFNFQMAINEPNAFDGNKPHYGNFKNVNNYFILVGKRGESEKIGYYGEKLVLECMNIGINTCWVALTFKHNKIKYNISKGEQFYVLISFGYGKSNGVKHKDKEINQLSNLDDNSPEWFKDGVISALKAPTAMNQQKFYIELLDNNIVDIRKRIGIYSTMDLGIVKYHFELLAGRNNFTYKKSTK